MKLFHYTSREAALEHILPTGRLRFGRLPRTNDPREFTPLWFTIGGAVGDDDDLTEGDPFDLIAKASELLRGSVHVLCFTMDRPAGRESHGRYGNGACRARMWAQYAGNHSGACLVFDGHRLERLARDQFKTTPERNLIRGPVKYMDEDEHPRMPMLHQPQAEKDLVAFIDSMVENDPEGLFFTKDWDWESETEYRLLLRGQTAEEEFMDVLDALEAVIVGPRMHPVYKLGVYRLCQELKVEALEIQWQMGPPVVVRMIDPARRPLFRPPPPPRDED